jgi:xanthine dehydrogenase accessory factor
LSCGGTLRIIIEPLDAAETAELDRALVNETLLAEAIRVDDKAAGKRLYVFDETTLGSLGNKRLDEAVEAEVRSISGEATETRTYGDEGEPHGDVRVFIQRALPRARMYIFGAIDFAHAMIRVAKLLAYDVTLCDARSAFATRERFPEADRIVVAWPDQFLRSAPVDERAAIVALTHDEKFDVPLIRAALQTRAGYIGVMGSRRTNARREEQLRELGTTESELARISAPIGLDLGARTPEETAIAIAAEIVALRHGREGGRLVNASGPIRGRSTTPVA